MQSKTIMGVITVAVLVGIGVTLTRSRTPAGAGRFRTSDPASLAATGRPQLVEFFHHA